MKLPRNKNNGDTLKKRKLEDRKGENMKIIIIIKKKKKT